MSRIWTHGAFVLLLAACSKGSSSEPPPPPPPAPTVQSIAVSPLTATLASVGATTSLTAEVRLSNGATGSQAVTWSTSSIAVATVNSGTVTAVGNGQATVTAAIGQITGSATITVNQAVASIQLLPADSVIKGAMQLRGAALDARGNPVAGAALQWESLTPLITTVDASGNLTPRSTGVARIRITSGSHTSTAIVRTIWNVTELSELFPLFEYTTASAQRRGISDVNQLHADARATAIGNVWSYLETILPASGSVATDMYFTSWPAIWLEAARFCGGQLFPSQTAWQVCTTPTMQHFLIPETTDDFRLIARFLARQFLNASSTDTRNFPWFVEGYSQWLAGGQLQGGAVVGKEQPAAIADFRSGDTQILLAPLDTLIRLPNVRYYENLPQRTPVAVRMAQSVMLVSYLAKEYPTVLPAIFAKIRATPGAAYSNAALIQEIVTLTGKTIPELEAAYLVHARAL